MHIVILNFLKIKKNQEKTEKANTKKKLNTNYRYSHVMCILHNFEIIAILFIEFLV